MSLGDNFPKLSSYKVAKAHLDCTKLVRGRAYAPIANDRSDSLRCNMRAGSERGVDCVYFRLYNTDVVTFFEDNTVRIEPYPSDATCTFISSLTWHFNAFHTKKNGMCVTTGHRHGAGPKWEVASGGIFFDLSVDGPKYRSGAVPQTENLLDKTRAAAVRKITEPLVKVIGVTMRFDPGLTKHIEAAGTARFNYNRPTIGACVEELKGGAAVEAVFPLMLDAIAALHHTHRAKWKDLVTYTAYGVYGAIVETPVPLGQLARATPWDKYAK